MNASCRSSYCLALGVALLSAGCSLGDFGYLSADYGNDAARGGGGLAGGVTFAGDGGTGARGGTGGSLSGGSGGTGGGDIEDQFFCDPKYAVFEPGSGGGPGVELPASGGYVIRKHGSATQCLLTPDWEGLGDARYWAITQDCGGPGTPGPAQPDEVWHVERLCSDVYRLTTKHDTPDERQLGIMDQSQVGTPVYSVISARSLDPFMLFHLRSEGLLDDKQRWRFSPVINSSSCIEQIGMARYGEFDVTRVVIYPCTGSLPNQSWNLLAVP